MGLGLTRAPMVLAAVMLLGGASFAPVAAQQQEQERLTESLQALDALVKAPDDAIPASILDKAEAVVIIPTLVKGGFIVGAEHGKGVMSARDRATGAWSDPAFVSLTGGSVGWQIGLQSVDLVLLVMNADGVDKLLASELKFGANASIAAGPVGRSAQAATDGKLTAEMLAYSRAKGLFAGVTLEGATLRSDVSANKAFYGAELTPKAILGGAASAEGRARAEQWRRILAKTMVQAADAK